MWRLTAAATTTTCVFLLFNIGRQCGPLKTFRYGSTVRFRYEIGFGTKFDLDSLICYFVRFQLLTIYENQFQRWLIAKPAPINYTLQEFRSVFNRRVRLGFTRAGGRGRLLQEALRRLRFQACRRWSRHDISPPKRTIQFQSRFIVTERRAILLLRLNYIFYFKLK
jgi:hypothetical protein